MKISTTLVAFVAAFSQVQAATHLLPRAIGDACKAPEGKGTCQTKSKCPGISYSTALCPKDPANVQCCVKIPCKTKSGSGFCRSVSNNGCSGGSFISGACPGSSDIRCCVKKSGGGGGGSGGGNGHIDQYSINHLKGLEGVRRNFYYDSVGKKTIGVGHNCDAHPGTCDKLVVPLSDSEVDRLLRMDLKIFESCVCKMPNAALMTKYQFAALVSFAFNSGCGGANRYFLDEMKSKSFSKICKDLPTTNTLNGLLTSRRKKEKELCQKATTVKSGC